MNRDDDIRGEKSFLGRVGIGVSGASTALELRGGVGTALRLGSSSTKYTDFTVAGVDGAVSASVNGKVKFYFGADTSTALEIPHTLALSYVVPGVMGYSKILWSNAHGAFWLRNYTSTAYVGVSGGRITAADTLRVGDYTTYSYIKPGDAAWTASSTVDVKRDITPTDTTSATDTRSILARVASVDPVRYRFRPTVFRVPFDTSYAQGVWFTLKLAQRQAMREEYRIVDSLRAEEKAAGYLTGFLAEQFNAAFGDPNSKEISYSDVVAVEWRAIQALIRRSRLQEQRIEALEEALRQMDARLKAGGL